METLNTFTADLQSMDLRLTEMEDKIDAIDVKLTQVVDAILGNPLTKTGGFMHDIDILKDKMAELERKQQKYENFKNKISWTVGLVVGGLMFLQYLINIYTNINRK
jgi:hypothetical protein